MTDAPKLQNYDDDSYIELSEHGLQPHRDEDTFCFRVRDLRKLLPVVSEASRVPTLQQQLNESQSIARQLWAALPSEARLDVGVESGWIPSWLAADAAD